MASVIGWLWFGVGVLGVVDAFRHSVSDWVFADRQRAFWVIFMLLLGPILVAIYAVAVRPRFPTGDETSASFLKDRP